MARVYEEKITIKLSTIVKDTDADPSESFLTDEQKETLVQAMEGLINDSTIVVEL